MTPRWYMSRRTALRSAAASVGLPFLEAMVKPGARAAAASPRRFVAIYGYPCGMVAKADPVQNCRVAPWTPTATGPFAAITPSDPHLKIFYDLGLQSKITIVTGLADRTGAKDHNCTGMLNSRKVDVEGPCGKYGTADHAIASELKKTHPHLQHLVLSGMKENGGGIPGVYRNYISFDPTKPLPVDRDPRAVFDKMFGAAAGPVPTLTPEARAAAMRRTAYNQSVLDSVVKDANALSGRLGRNDRRKLEEYLTGIRELEEQMKNAGTPVVSGCTPGAPPATYTREMIADRLKLDDRVKVWSGLIVKGIECDRTRVVSFMMALAYGQDGGWPHIGLPTDWHHAVSHYRSPIGISRSLDFCINYMNTYTRWATQRYAELLKALDSRVEPDGSTLLDNTVTYCTGEHMDSHDHTNASMPVLLGGRLGRNASGGWNIAAGRHVRYFPWPGKVDYSLSATPPTPRERTVTDMLWGIIKLMGVNLPDFGNAKVPLDFTWADAMAS